MKARKFLITIFLSAMVTGYGCSTIQSQTENLLNAANGASDNSQIDDSDATAAAEADAVSPEETNSFIAEAILLAKDMISDDSSANCKEILTRDDVKRFSRPTLDHTISALRNLTRGAELTFEAVDLAKDAERMALIRTKLEQDPTIMEDQEKLKELLEEVNGAAEKISQMDYESKLNSSTAKKNVGEMILRFGVAGYFDTRAQASAGHFLDCGAHTSTQIKDNPKMLVTHHELFSAVKDYMSVTQLVTGNIASQAKQISSISSGLIDYAQKHDIEMPTKDELEKEVKKYEPESDDEEDLT